MPYLCVQAANVAHLWYCAALGVFVGCFGRNDTLAVIASHKQHFWRAYGHCGAVVGIFVAIAGNTKHFTQTQHFLLRAAQGSCRSSRTPEVLKARF